MIAVRNGDNKGTKYNHVTPIDLDTIPIEEREQALLEFAEGSVGLEKCLRIMWENNLKTHACCAGNDSPYDEAYIAMADGVDVFSFLSNNLLLNDMISLESGNHQVIRFAGTQENKDNLMLTLAFDISTGKKQNSELLKEKIGKPLNLEWEKEALAYSRRKAGFSEEEIAISLRRLELGRIIEYGTKEDAEKALPEYDRIFRL